MFDCHFDLFTYVLLCKKREDIGRIKKYCDEIFSKEANSLIKQYNLIPEHVKYIFGIEGLDYLKNINDIDECRKPGL